MTFVWDGSSDGGAIAPDGSYRLRIRLRDQHRTIVIPTPVHVDTAPPEVELLRVSPTVFSPDRDRRRDRVVVVFRVSERSRALLFVDGRAAVRGRLSPAGRKRVFWGGKVDGRLRRPGSYSLTVRAHDRAGNVSARTDPVSVRIRYIELPVKRVEVRRLGTLRFRVATDARRFRWSLVPAGRSSRPLLTGRGTRVLVVTRLPRSVKPGRYRLRVEEGGYGDEAVVVVRKAKR